MKRLNKLLYLFKRSFFGLWGNIFSIFREDFVIVVSFIINILRLILTVFVIISFVWIIFFFINFINLVRENRGIDLEEIKKSDEESERFWREVNRDNDLDDED